MADRQSKHRNMLVAALGSYGDVFPMVGIAEKLKQRGHNVTLFTHAHFVELARTHELDCVPLDKQEDYQNFSNHPDLFDSRKAFYVFMQAVVLPNIYKAYTAMIDYVQPGNTIIISPMTVFAARLIQEKFGTPLVTIHTIPLQIKSAYEIPRIAGPSLPDWSPTWLTKFYWWIADRFVVDRIICPDLNSFRQKIGLKPVRRVITKWVHSPDRVICMYPDWFAAPQPDWPPNTINTGFPLFDQDDEHELATEVQQFLQAGPPPVVFMPGSLMQQGRNFFEVSLKVCEKLEYRAIFLTRFSVQIPVNLPPTVKHFLYVPFSHLLPHSALLVHHGGIGTTAQALRAGVPQLIHPLAYDQFDNAARVHKLGVGESIKPVDYSVEKVSESLRTLMTSSSIKQQCQEVASRFENVQPLEATCDIIEGLLPELFIW